jgi:asparagine synthase (glutamine-hydrolysing)
MCGISGFLGAGDVDFKAALSAMSDRLTHRGPDAEGQWFDQTYGLAMGHRRLAIVDLSEAGHQPMISPSGRYVTVFNGEIYNHLSLRERLSKDNIEVRWRGHSDTESMLAAVDVWGLQETLEAAVGMFAFALWDRQESCLYLARDRFGEKPLYYGWNRGVFLFGSELKALRAFPGFDAKINLDAVALFLRYNYVPCPWSIWKGIGKLPPGNVLKVSLSRQEAEPIPYWSLADVLSKRPNESVFPSYEEASIALESRLSDTLEKQMLADVPLGALLSGGVDSSAIVALMQAHSRRPVRTFSIGFDDKRFDESTHAATVASHLGTDHTELVMTPRDVLDAVPRMPSLYDEPFADSSQLPTSLVMALAKEHVSVALTGDGGDEVFGGYNRYLLAPKLWRIIKILPLPLRRRFSQLVLRIPVHMWAKVEKVLGPILGQVNVADKLHKLAGRLEHARNVDELYVALVTEWQNAETVVPGSESVRTLLQDMNEWPSLLDSQSRMMALDTLTYMPDDILVKVDRAAMGVSLETRAPFLDHRIVEFAWSMPLDYKISAGQGKRILKDVLYRYVPSEMVDRPKMGFGVPLDDWLRTDLREWAERLLSPQRLALTGILKVDVIRDIWRRHLSGERAFGHRLWSVLMLQAWLEENDVTVDNLAFTS